MVVKATLRVRHEGCFSERLQGTSYVAQISGDRAADVLLAHAETPTELERVHALLVSTHRDPIEVVNRTGTTLLARTRHPAGGVIDTILAHGCPILWPALYREGEETFTVVASDRARVDALLRSLSRLGSARVESVHEVPADVLDVGFSLGDLTHGLTKRQLEVIRRAIEEGYYESPRRTTSEALAASFGLSRSTFEEHLRKAERTVLHHVGDALNSYPALGEAATRKPGRPPR